MITSKKKVIEELCELVTQTSVELFGESEPHDCFCGSFSNLDGNFLMNEEAIIFIKTAVKQKLEARS